MVQSTFAKFYLRDMEKQQKNLQLLGSVVAAKKMVGARCSGRSQEVNKTAQLSCSWCQTIKGNGIVKLYWCFQGSKWRSCREKRRFLFQFQDLSLDRTVFFFCFFFVVVVFFFLFFFFCCCCCCCCFSPSLKWRENPNPPV